MCAMTCGPQDVRPALCLLVCTMMAKRCHPTQSQQQGMSKKCCKGEQGFVWQERNKMIEEYRLREQCRREGMISRPAPQYRMGQSVLHYWASWMSGAANVPRKFSEKDRPKWVSAEILSLPMWMEEGTVYGGCPAVGWFYKVAVGTADRDFVPEHAMMELPDEGQMRPDPSFYVEFDTHNLMRTAAGPRSYAFGDF